MDISLDTIPQPTNLSSSSLWSWFWYGIMTAFIGSIMWVKNKITKHDEKFATLELDIAKNYATNTAVDKLEAKMDVQHQLINNKLDTLNQNILTLVKDKING